jgi:multiple antibiotic resistance protein
MFRTFLEAFIPLFVAIDPVGLIPVFLSVTERMDDARRRYVAAEAVAAGFVIALGFMFVGEALFRFVGITTADFRIAGGVILLVLAVVDLLTVGKPAVHADEMVGIVPLAMPLIAGPATLTTVLVLGQRATVGYPITALALAVNFAILLLALRASEWICRIVGNNTLRALSKLVVVLLAAIAVNFIRVGVMEALREG